MESWVGALQRFTNIIVIGNLLCAAQLWHRSWLSNTEAPLCHSQSIISRRWHGIRPPKPGDVELEWVYKVYHDVSSVSEWRTKTWVPTKIV